MALGADVTSCSAGHTGKLTMSLDGISARLYDSWRGCQTPSDLDP